MAGGLAKKTKELSKNRYLLAVAFLIIGLALGAGGGVLAYQYFNPYPQNTYELNNQYPLVDPILYCGTDAQLSDQQANALDTQLQNAITAETTSGKITTASIYFKDLNGGPWVGINEYEPFDPGSLLKLPLAMAVYKEAEGSSTLLSTEADYTGTETDDPQFFAPKLLAPGNYTLAQLVSQMLISLTTTQRMSLRIPLA